MQRRVALKTLAWSALGMSVLPQCAGDPLPVFERLDIARRDLQFMDRWLDYILPLGEDTELVPEAPLDFVLYMIDDIYAPDQVESFQAGMKKMPGFIRDNFSKPLEQLTTKEQQELFASLARGKDEDQDLRYFYQESRNLLIRQMTSSERFMTEELDYEMVPGYFSGCVSTAKN
jgi:hypothetical protein